MEGTVLPSSEGTVFHFTYDRDGQHMKILIRKCIPPMVILLFEYFFKFGFETLVKVFGMKNTKVYLINIFYFYYIKKKCTSFEIFFEFLLFNDKLSLETQNYSF